MKIPENKEEKKVLHTFLFKAEKSLIEELDKIWHEKNYKTRQDFLEMVFKLIIEENKK